MDILGGQGLDDLVGADRPVEVPLFVRSGLDRDRQTGKPLGQTLHTGQALRLDLAKQLTMLLDHTAMVFGRHGRQSLRNQVVVRVARLHLDDITLLSEGTYRLDQEQLDTAVRAERKTFALMTASAFIFLNLNHVCHLDYSFV